MPSPDQCPCNSCVQYRRNFPTEATFNDEPPSVDPWNGLLDEPPITPIPFEDLSGPDDDELVDDTVAACVACSEVYERNDMVSVEDAFIRMRWSERVGMASYAAMACRDCATECEHCGDWYRYLSDHQNRYCDGCNDHFCDSVDLRYCDDCGHDRCDDCGGCACYQGSSIRDYNWRPPAFVLKGDRSQVMMGIELEVSGHEQVIVDCVLNYDDSEDHLYMKHDGSVNGVEIVTHPGTLEWNRNEFDWASLLDDMADMDCHIDLRENGLHVHVARDSFNRGVKGRSDRHAMTWLMFLYRNHDDLQLLARRDAGQWAAFDAPQSGELNRKARRPVSHDRYAAVNCNNRDTYELRFFASTLNPVEFFAAIEFADASVEYTRQLKAADVMRGNGMSWAAFVDWADAQGDRYPALCAEGRRRVPARVDATNKPWYPVSGNRRPPRSDW